MKNEKITYLYDTVVNVRHILYELDALLQDQLSELEETPSVPTALTKDELVSLMEDETWISEGKNMGWIQPVGFNFVVPALLDIWEREIVAVTSAMRDGSDWYWMRDYGKTWVAYLERPEFKED